MTTTKPAAALIPESGTDSPQDLTSKTGYCTHRNHKKCPYRPGGACENGIALSDGGFYMCPCSCHMQQKHAVQGKRLQVSLAARKEAVAADPPIEPWNEVGAKARKSVVATILADHAPKARKSAPAKGRPASPKSTESTPKQSGKGKASTAAKAAPKPAKEGLTTAEKRDVRIKMAAVLREMRTAPLNPLSAREMAYVEAHWLKYIDPDLDKARRDAAAAK